MGKIEFANPQRFDPTGTTAIDNVMARNRQLGSIRLDEQRRTTAAKHIKPEPLPNRNHIPVTPMDDLTAFRFNQRNQLATEFALLQTRIAEIKTARGGKKHWAPDELAVLSRYKELKYSLTILNEQNAQRKERLKKLGI